MIRVVLAEDGVLLRAGLAGLLERFGFEVIAQVGDAFAHSNTSLSGMMVRAD